MHQSPSEIFGNKPLLRPLSRVQLVFNVASWSSQDASAQAYTQFANDNPVGFGGIMISGKWGEPAMDTEDVINFPVAPEIVIYQ